MQAVILAGGKGSRLEKRLAGLPKPMVDFCGKPLLEHQIDLVRSHGVTDVLLLLGYNPQPIQDYFGDGSAFGLSIRHILEQDPLGSAGAVLAAFDELQERFFVLYGDTILNVDLGRLLQSHAATGADGTLFLHPNDHPNDSDLVEVDGDNRIRRFLPYPRSDGRYHANLVNAALYVLEKAALGRWINATGALDFGKDLFPRMLETDQYLSGYISREYIKDVGTPERLDRASSDYRSGKIGRGSLVTPAPAVFLDRDGTINREVNRVKNPDEFVLLEGAAEAVARLNHSEYKVVVVTNQPVVARGDCTEEGLREIHNKMETLLGEGHAFVDAIYYCPHHPHKGFAGERPELKMQCNCRKPATGMIAAACRDMNLDLSRSWMVGDSLVDVRMAAAAGMPSILVETGHTVEASGEDEAPDFRVPSLREAADFILEGNPNR